jgi:hypothetical protein
MSADDITLINRHLAELREEVTELRGAVEQTAALAREAALRDVHDALAPAIAALANLEAHGEPAGADAAVVAERLEQALPALGLTPVHEAGKVLELWPEQANGELLLDRPVPPGATMARGEVRARGWTRGARVLVRPRGVVLEVIEEGGDDESLEP